MIAPTTRLRRKEGLLTQRAGDTWILLDPEDGQYYALDEVSGRIWQLCDGTRTVAALVAAVREEYDAPADEVEADVAHFLEELLDGKLVTPEA